MLNKDRLVTITNCMMHFPKLPNRSLFIDISRGGGCFMCVCVRWLSNLLVKTYFYRNESVIEKPIWRTIHALHYTLAHSLIHITRMFWFLLGVSKRLKQFSLYERDLWHQKQGCTQNHNWYKYDADSPLNHITRRTFDFRDLYLVSYLFLVCLFRECMSS